MKILGYQKFLDEYKAVENLGEYEDLGERVREEYIFDYIIRSIVCSVYSTELFDHNNFSEVNLVFDDWFEFKVFKVDLKSLSKGLRYVFFGLNSIYFVIVNDGLTAD